MVLELALRGDATSKSVRSWTDGSIRCVSTLRWTYMTPISLDVGPCKLERNHNLKNGSRCVFWRTYSNPLSDPNDDVT